MPDALANKDVLFHFEGFRVDDGYTVGGPESHKRPLAVLGVAYAHRLDGVRGDALDLELDFSKLLAGGGVDDGDGSTDLRTDPDLRAVMGIFSDTGTGIDEDVVEDLVRLGVDEMRHVGRFRGVDQHLPVGAHSHALGLHADRYFGDNLVGLDIDYGDEIIVLVGDIKRIA